jgi:DnaJ like chaperone protein
MKNWLGKTIASVRSVANGKISAKTAMHHITDTHAGSVNDSASSQLTSGSVHHSFFDCLFLSLGHLCKADGRINEREIAFVSQLMNKMELTHALREKAMQRFNQGKEQRQSFISDSVKALQQHSKGSVQVSNLLTEVLLQCAYSDGKLNNQEHLWFQSLCFWLSFNQVQFTYIHQKVVAGLNVANQRGNKATSNPKDSIQACYLLLGLEEKASKADVKLAYKRKMSQYHPDKISAMDVSQEFVILYTQKATQIRAAYDRIITLMK